MNQSDLETKIISMAEGIARIETKLEALPCPECSKAIEEWKRVEAVAKFVFIVGGILWAFVSGLFQGALSFMIHKG